MPNPKAVRAVQNAHQNKDFISTLPADSIKLIASFLLLGDVVSLRAVSRLFATVLRQQALERLTASIKIREVVPFGSGCFYIPDGEGLYFSSINHGLLILTPLDDHKIQQLKVCGSSVYCVTDRGVYVWGGNGALGLGHTDKVSVPTRLAVLDDHKIQQLQYCHGGVYCVTNQDVFVWGDNEDGGLGLRHMDEVLVPTRVTALDGLKIQQLKSYRSVSVYCVTNRGVFVWGFNESGRLGLGHRNNVLTPHLVTLDPAKSESVAWLQRWRLKDGLTINLDYCYQTRDIAVIWPKRLELLQRFLTQQNLPLINFKLLLEDGSSLRASLKNIQLDAGQQIVFVPFKHKDHWVALMLVFSKEHVLSSVGMVDSRSDQFVEDKSVCVAMVLKTIQDAYPNFHADRFHTNTHYMLTDVKDSAVLLIENAIAMIQSVYAGFNLLAFNFAPHACNQTDFTEFRHSHLQLTGGEQSPYYSDQVGARSYSSITPGLYTLPPTTQQSVAVEVESSSSAVYSAGG